MNVSDATSLSQTSAKSGPYPKFKNDLGVGEIRIGAREFKCVGASPPHDHPHVYIDIGDDEAILCPYCATLFRHDPRLALFEADPPECRFVELET